MWPAIGNFAHDFPDRLEQRTRHQIVPIPRQRNRWMARSLRGTGTRLVLLADRLDTGIR